jgi:hypothetical protein
MACIYVDGNGPKSDLVVLVLHAEPPYVTGLSVSDKGPIDAGSFLAAFGPFFLSSAEIF